MACEKLPFHSWRRGVEKLEGYGESGHERQRASIMNISQSRLLNNFVENKGDVAALVRSEVNGLRPFESTIEQTTETMPLATKQ